MQEKISNKIEDMRINNLYVVLIVFIFALVSLGMFLVLNSQKERTVTVSGKSSSVMKNEIATFTVTAEANNEDKQIAVKEVSTISNEIVAALKNFGIADKDFQTANLNVYQTQEPVVEKGATVYRPGNWYASYTVNATLRDLTRSTELTALLAGFDNTSIYGPSLQIDDKNVDEASLLQSALADARAKANAMAAKAGKRVGSVVSMAESSQYTNPIVYMKSADTLTGIGGGGGFPIEAGTSTIQKYVVVTYLLK